MRMMNALYQIAAGFLLWQFLRRIKVGAGVAFLTALLWTAHPMNCENVIWIVERKSVLCAMFGFGALLVWTASGWWRLPLLNLLYALAFMSKSSAMGLLPLLAALEFFVPREHTSSGKRLFKSLLTLAGPALITVSLLIPNMKTFSGEIVDPPGGTVWTALLTDVEIFFRYIHHILVPFRLTFYNNVEPIVSLADVRFWIYGILMAGFFTFLLWAVERDKRSLAILGIVWFFAALGPNSNIVAIPFWFQDRYAFLSIPGLLISTILGIQGLLAKKQVAPPASRGIVLGYCGFIVVLLAFRATYYANDEILELDAVRHQPGSAVANLRAAEIFAKRMNESSPYGKTPDPHSYVLFGKAAAFHYENLLKCSDIENFYGHFNAKLGAAEILGQLGMHTEVKKSLAGWLPPAHLEMISAEELTRAKDEGKLSRKMFKRRYVPKTLSRAWAISAESSLQLSLQPSLAMEQRLDFLNTAVREADEAIKLPLSDESGKLVKARALIQISEFERLRKNTQVADESLAAGIKILESVSPGSRWRQNADALLARVRKK